MTFTTTIPVRFGDVDPAGIVFYPRFFEMLNTAMEDWCAGILALPFRAMHFDRRIGIPMVNINADFKRPSRLGDILEVGITTLSVGNSSCRLQGDFSCNGELRIKMNYVVVCADLDSHSAQPWPKDLLTRILREQEVCCL